MPADPDSLDIRGECRWCGLTYADHTEKQVDATAARFSCRMLRRNFMAKQTAREPAVQVCGCDEAHVWKARALAAERQLATAKAQLDAAQGILVRARDAIDATVAEPLESVG